MRCRSTTCGAEAKTDAYKVGTFLVPAVVPSPTDVPSILSLIPVPIVISIVFPVTTPGGAIGAATVDIGRAASTPASSSGSGRTSPASPGASSGLVSRSNVVVNNTTSPYITLRSLGVDSRSYNRS